MKINSNFKNIEDGYLFSTIAKKVSSYKNENPNADIIRLGIGDVTLPLTEPVVDALKKASVEMGRGETFHGYGEEQGYLFLRESIKSYYQKKGVSLTTDDIFISDGAKSDLGNILDIFSKDNNVLIPTPVYPVYVDTNVMAGRNITFLEGNMDNNFLPLPKDEWNVDIIYLCSPSNPTGAVYNYEMLKTWVDFAKSHNAIILFDSAYEAFITNPDLPTSIYEVEGAKECCIEFCSLSKTAGFTGTRCGYTVVPKDIECDGMNLNKMWTRRQTTKFNGVPYIIQRGAEAVFTDKGMAACKKNIEYYLENAKIIMDGLKQKNIWFTGGENSPYVWLKCPNGMKSWEYFDHLLKNANVVGTPGVGFGSTQDDYFRLTSFGNRENVILAMERILKNS